MIFVLMINQMKTSLLLSSSDLLPLDLLVRVLPDPSQIHMVQSRGSRGLRLSAPLSFPATQVFTNCEHFPEEFSLVVTFKLQWLRPKVRAKSLTRDGSEGSGGRLLLGLLTGGTTPDCTGLEEGQLWFNTGLKALYLCDGGRWTSLLHSKQRLDYVDDYQDLYTNSETFDVEVFTIPNEGLFLATANRDSRSGSGIYKWILGSFQKYQNISTHEARAWKYFTISGKHFLVVANSGEVQQERSVLYRWSPVRRRFVQHQTLDTHSALDWEAFHIHNHSFLVVANHRQGTRSSSVLLLLFEYLIFNTFNNPNSVKIKRKVIHCVHINMYLCSARDSNHNIDSVLYRWNPLTKV
uniref:Uncharacterized protein n=1 Tax=Periophthalmus magnuspinnatus TaxID=409849 RepID=A0A3B4AYQ4_9GOBI